jgi:hypothetical protein
MGIEYGFSWALQYLLVASWIWVAHNYGSEIRKTSRSGLRALGAILFMSFAAALIGGGVVASYQPTPAKAHGVITAAFLISFIPAILVGPGKR